MPTSPFWGKSGGNLTIAVNNGTLSQSRVDDMATSGRLVVSTRTRCQSSASTWNAQNH
jgi:hypothetical protein